MENDMIKDIPIFDLEVIYNPKTKIITIIANEYAASYLAGLFKGLEQGGLERHYHISQEVEGMSGNVNELLLMKR